MSIKSKKIKVYDMTCTSCEKTIERNIKRLQGILYVKANYIEQNITVDYASDLCSIEDIENTIKSSGYSLERNKEYKFVGILLLGVAIILLSASTNGYNMNNMLNGATYFVVFIVGLLTSFHCIGMCGGIMLSQTIQKNDLSNEKSVKPAILYNLGRITSYTILGGLVGALSSIFSLSLKAQAALQIFAALFMIITGLNIMGVGLFRKINISLPFKFCSLKNKPKTPFLVGLLNGLMPCGPLQTMQLYALSTGSFVKGALSMFIFSLGTVPLMLSFGAISGILSKGNTKKLLKFSGVLVIVLGLIMGRRGLALSGINMPFSSLPSNNSYASSSNSNIVKSSVKDGVQEVKITADRKGYSPNVIYVKKGVPVKFIVDGKQITSCNNEIVFPSLNIKKPLENGENLIEFTPNDGDINFSCWMGMIRGVVKVVDNLNTVDTSTNNGTTIPPAGGGGCCSVIN